MNHITQRLNKLVNYLIPEYASRYLVEQDHQEKLKLFIELSCFFREYQTLQSRQKYAFGNLVAMRSLKEERSEVVTRDETVNVSDKQTADTYSPKPKINGQQGSSQEERLNTTISKRNPVNGHNGHIPKCYDQWIEDGGFYPLSERRQQRIHWSGRMLIDKIRDGQDGVI